jgi:exo-beta-1,3-glucanase (GH17 family)
MIAAVWWWLATPVTLARAPIDPAKKLECVSYAPFRGDQNPRIPGLIINPEQIAEDLGELAKISGCVRIYSVDNGLDKVPELAAKVGLKVLLGVWIGRNRAKNAELIDTAVALIEGHPGVITAIIVGNEVLLRGDLSVSDLRETVRSVKRRVSIPVTYADVWEFWLRYREVGDDVDFVTAHFLPYWEDFPTRAEDAAAHVDDVRKQMTVVFPTKEILIGETGWPSKGRMRDGALPSRINQARFISEVLDRAQRENFRVNLFEAYEEPWKRQWEGTVGAYWGLYDGGHRGPKYPPGEAISNYPFWKLQMVSGIALSLLVFGAGWLALRRWPQEQRSIAWGTIAVSATVGGILLGISVEKVLQESYILYDWLAGGMLLAAGIVAPLLAPDALISRRPVPTFFELLGRREDRTSHIPTKVLGFTLMAITLVAAVTALGLVFDPRGRDFPFASLAMAEVPFLMLTLLEHRKPGRQAVAETLFAGLFLLSSLYILFNEGHQNWQSLWTCAAFFLLSVTLWRARGVAALGGLFNPHRPSEFVPVAASRFGEIEAPARVPPMRSQPNGESPVE